MGRATTDLWGRGFAIKKETGIGHRKRDEVTKNDEYGL